LERRKLTGKKDGTINGGVKNCENRPPKSG